MNSRSIFKKKSSIRVKTLHSDSEHPLAKAPRVNVRKMSAEAEPPRQLLDETERKRPFPV